MKSSSLNSDTYCTTPIKDSTEEDPDIIDSEMISMLQNKLRISYKENNDESSTNSRSRIQHFTKGLSKTKSISPIRISAIPIIM